MRDGGCIGSMGQEHPMPTFIHPYVYTLHTYMQTHIHEHCSEAGRQTCSHCTMLNHALAQGLQKEMAASAWGLVLKVGAGVVCSMSAFRVGLLVTTNREGGGMCCRRGQCERNALACKRVA